MKNGKSRRSGPFGPLFRQFTHSHMENGKGRRSEPFGPLFRQFTHPPHGKRQLPLSERQIFTATDTRWDIPSVFVWLYSFYLPSKRPSFKKHCNFALGHLSTAITFITMSIASSYHAVTLSQNNSVLSQKSPEAYFSDDFINLARDGRSIGLTRITPVGVGCAMYSTPEEWATMQRSRDTNCNSRIYSTLVALAQNIYIEERNLVNHLSTSRWDRQSDVYAAFQSMDTITSTSRHSDGRIRRAHMMTCIVDRLVWVSTNTGSATISPPTQFPHHPFPTGPHFLKYCHLMETWPHTIHEYASILHDCEADNLVNENSTPIQSIFSTLKFSSNNRIKNTVMDNLTRCVLALRALTYVCINF
jgi:hypothetical protein